MYQFVLSKVDCFSTILEEFCQVNCFFRHEFKQICDNISSAVEYKPFFSRIADDREIPIGIVSKKQPTWNNHINVKGNLSLSFLFVLTQFPLQYILSIADDHEILQEFRSEIEPILVALLITYQVFGLKRHLVSLHPFPLLTAEKFG